MSHPAYWIALQAALGYHSKKVRVLMDFFGDAEGVFEATEQELKACPTLTEKEVARILERPFQTSKKIWEECQAADITPIGPDSNLYPDGLKNLPDMPCVLYVKGKLPKWDQLPAVSVVGTRKPTTYGKIVCKRLASVLAVAGVTVVSGGALGLDSVAHRAALDVGGVTVAVLGCGMEAGYLKENQSLREEICKNGALISEYPPKAPATRYTFPARNRIIAALSLGTVVIEAGEKSGSLITADHALEQGKDVFAVPGSIMSPGFYGSNRLISQGAVAVFGGLDILEKYQHQYFNRLNMNKAVALHKEHLKEMLVIEDPKGDLAPPKAEKPHSQPPKPKKVLQPAPKGLSDRGALVYNTLLGADRLSLHELVERTQLETALLLRVLTRLEVQGLITKDPAGNYQPEN